ncbi:MAG: hypothetical protein ACOCX2_11585 [Armatimonadota bacterium]
MDQQVSPAVVIIVLILIVAILVGLYFLVVERGPQTSEETGMEVGPMDGAMPPDAGVPDPGDADAEAMPDADQDQADGDTEQTDPDPEGNADAAGAADEATGDDSGE